MEEDVEVIFESWVLKLTGLDSRRAFRLSNQWKKRYLILLRQHESASLLYYNQKPTSLNATPKGLVLLEPYYRVEKRQNVRGQQFVVSLTTPTKRLVVAVDDEGLFHLLAFFLQVQVKLNEDVEEECFVVRPDNTDDQRRIGARGNMCLLHLSPCGLTVSLQLSKCVIVQWPLTCIRNYESTSRGQFIVTVGKRANMGVGRYVFNTRLGQDNIIYDRLDRYVQEGAGSKYQSQADNISETSLVELEHLHSLTYVQSNPQFSNHLRKISRDIYDSLWQHLGSTKLKASSPDLVADSPDARQKTFRRTGSMDMLDNAGSVPSVPTTPRGSYRRKFSHPNTSLLSTPTSPDDFSSLPRNFHRSKTSQDSKRIERHRTPWQLIDSTYLHPEEALSETNYENDAMLYQVGEPAQPIDAVPLSYTSDGEPSFLGQPLTRKPPLGTSAKPSQTVKSPKKSRSSDQTTPPLITPESSHYGSTSSEPLPSPVVMRLDQRPRLQRLQSRSCDDIVTYMDMGGGPKGNTNDYMETNGENNKSNDMGTSKKTYSYATQDEVEQTRAAAQRLARRRASGSQNSYLARDKIPTGFIRMPLVRKQSMKKAMSNPSLMDLTQRQLALGDGMDTTLSSIAMGDHLAGQSSTNPSQTHPNTNGTSSPTQMQEQRSSPITSTVFSSPVKMKQPSTARGVPSDGLSPFTNRARGIPNTTPSKIFRKPKYEMQSPTNQIPPGQWNVGRDEEWERSHRNESVSSGYGSSSSNATNVDIRETHC